MIYRKPRESLAKRRPSGASRTKLTRAQPVGVTSWSTGRKLRVSGNRTRSRTSTASPRFTSGAGSGLSVICARAPTAADSNTAPTAHDFTSIMLPPRETRRSRSAGAGCKNRFRLRARSRPTALQLLAVEGAQLCRYAEPLVVAPYRGRDGALQVVSEEQAHARARSCPRESRRFSSIRSSGYRS